MSQRIKYTVIAEENNALSCIGVYSDYEKAYGAALLYLDEMSEYHGTDGQELMITTTFRLEADTGFGMSLKDENKKTLYSAYILDVPATSDESDGEG